MSDDLLDTIDHVLADHEMGPDAMRWTPEPASDLPVVVPTLNAVEIARSMTRALDAVGKVFAQAAKSMAALAPRIMELRQQVEAAQAAERQSAMHSAYRARSRRRTRSRR